MAEKLNPGQIGNKRKCFGKNCPMIIQFIGTPAGKSMPIEPELLEIKEGSPHLGQKIVSEEGRMITAIVGSKGYLTHWGDSCADSDKFKKNRKERHGLDH